MIKNEFYEFWWKTCKNFESLIIYILLRKKNDEFEWKIEIKNFSKKYKRSIKIIEHCTWLSYKKIIIGSIHFLYEINLRNLLY